MKQNFALYRYPDSTDFELVECDGDGLLLSSSMEAVGSADGFVFAPFSVGDNTPVVTIKGKSVRFDVSGIEELPSYSCRITEETADRESYMRDFGLFHDLVEKGEADKIVLARTAEIKTDTPADPLQMFLSACRNNPHCFVALVSTDVTGTWLTATPEILLERRGGEYHTMALAGTMPIGGDATECVWSEKNTAEQRYVADYIRGIVKEYTGELTEEGPYTFRSGNIAHLRTDFRFRADERVGIANIVSRLHPTPAVCGFPTGLCRKFILDNETAKREYYSGFCGAVSPGDDFRLFVTLRCMKISGDALTLYAGGGILPDSRVEDEWNETISKMQAMRTCITGQ